MVENKTEFAEGGNPPIVYVSATPSAPLGVPQQPKAEWSCSKCTLINPARKLYCIACFHRHPDLTPATTSDNEDRKDDDDCDYDDDIDEYPPFPNNNPEVFVQPVDGAVYVSEILEAQGEEDPFHKKIRRRMRRKKRMVAGGVAGVAVGAVLCSPALIVAGAIGGVVGSRIVSKRKEQAKDQRLARERYLMANAAQATASVKWKKNILIHGVTRGEVVQHTRTKESLYI